jgi:hypothetical protein
MSERAGVLGEDMSLLDEEVITLIGPFELNSLKLVELSSRV